MSKRAVLVTGAASGVGKATAELFLSRGFLTIVTDVNAVALTEAFPQRSGASYRTLVADLAAPEQVEDLARQVAGLVRSEGWSLVGLALVAGIGWTAPSLLVGEELVRKTMQVNALAPYALIRGLFGELERAPDGGRIVVVSSIAGCLPQAWTCAYSMSKAAVESMCDCLRFELEAVDARVTITSLLPSLIDTPILDRNIAAEGADWSRSPFLRPMQRFTDALARMRPTPRTLAPGDVAARIVGIIDGSRPVRPREVVARSGALAVRLVAVLPDKWRDWFRRKSIDWA